MEVVAPYSLEPNVRIINCGTISPQAADTAWAISDDAIFHFALLVLDTIPTIPQTARVKQLFLRDYSMFKIFFK